MQTAYPVQLSLQGRAVLVVGAGRVAERKLRRLLDAGAELTVVAPDASIAVREWAEAGHLVWKQRPFRSNDVQGKALAFAATDAAEVNGKVVSAAQKRGVWVNCVDDPAVSSFTVPALARGEHARLAVSSGARAPAASRRLAQELEEWLRRGPDRFVAEIAARRPALLEEAGGRARIQALAEGPLWEACIVGDEEAIVRACETDSAGKADVTGGTGGTGEGKPPEETPA